MLLGSLPMGSVEIGKGRWAHLSPEHLEEWVATPNLTVPVLEDHDPNRCVGWCNKVTFSRKQNKAFLFGDLDGPDAGRVARLVRAHLLDGLSPRVRTHPGRVWHPWVGSWGDGDVVEFPEVSMCWQPRIPDARWLGV